MPRKNLALPEKIPDQQRLSLPTQAPPDNSGMPGPALAALLRSFPSERLSSAVTPDESPLLVHPERLSDWLNTTATLEPPPAGISSAHLEPPAPQERVRDMRGGQRDVGPKPVLADLAPHSVVLPRDLAEKTRQVPPALEPLAVAAATAELQQRQSDATHPATHRFAAGTTDTGAGKRAVVDPGERVDNLSPAQRAWFGDSKIVTEEGKPRKMFHGSPWDEFEKFDLEKLSNPENLLYGPGFYFTDREEIARDYQKRSSGLTQSVGVKEWLVPPAVAKERLREILKSAQAQALPKIAATKTAQIAAYAAFKDSITSDNPGGDQELYKRYAHLEDVIYGIEKRWGDALERLKLLERAEDLSDLERVVTSQSNSVRPVDRIGFKQTTYGASTTDLFTEPEGHVLPAYLRVKNPFDIDAPLPKNLYDKLPEEISTALTREFQGQDNPDAQPTGKWLYEKLSGAAEQGGFGSKTQAKKWLQSQGFDGITHKGQFGARPGQKVPGVDEHQVVIAFEPTQIKHAENLNPDPLDPRHRYAAGTTDTGGQAQQAVVDPGERVVATQQEPGVATEALQPQRLTVSAGSSWPESSPFRLPGQVTGESNHESARTPGRLATTTALEHPASDTTDTVVDRPAVVAAGEQVGAPPRTSLTAPELLTPAPVPAQFSDASGVASVPVPTVTLPTSAVEHQSARRVAHDTSTIPGQVPLPKTLASATPGTSEQTATVRPQRAALTVPAITNHGRAGGLPDRVGPSVVQMAGQRPGRVQIPTSTPVAAQPTPRLAAAPATMTPAPVSAPGAAAAGGVVAEPVTAALTDAVTGVASSGGGPLPPAARLSSSGTLLEQRRVGLAGSDLFRDTQGGAGRGLNTGEILGVLKEILSTLKDNGKELRDLKGKLGQSSGVRGSMPGVENRAPSVVQRHQSRRNNEATAQN